MKYLFLIIILLVSFSFGFGQKKSNICLQPFSYQFDKFNYQEEIDIEKRLSDFQKKLDGLSDEAEGVVYVYGGKVIGVNEVNELVTKIKKILKVPDKYTPDYKYSVSNKGYHFYPTVELFIKPLKCSQTPESNSNLDLEQVEFIEAPKENTLKRASAEIENNVLENRKGKCPPTAAAVGACKKDSFVEVYIIINQEGNVIFVSAISGHPLLRRAAVDAAKIWKFKPTVINEKKFNVVGRIKIEFEESEYIIMNTVSN